MVSAGNYIHIAAAYAGVSREALYEWLRRGARHRSETWEGGQANSLYAQLHRAIEFGLANAEVRNVVVVANAAQGGAVIGRKTVTVNRIGEDGQPFTETTTTEQIARPEWTASAWWLERHDPARWGRRSDPLASRAAL